MCSRTPNDGFRIIYKVSRSPISRHHSCRFSCSISGRLDLVLVLQRSSSALKWLHPEPEDRGPESGRFRVLWRRTRTESRCPLRSKLWTCRQNFDPVEPPLAAVPASRGPMRCWIGAPDASGTRWCCGFGTSTSVLVLISTETQTDRNQTFVCAVAAIM